MKTTVKIVLLLTILNTINLNAQSLIPLNTSNFRSADIPFHNPSAISFYENYHIIVTTLFLHTGLADESMQYSLLNFAYPLTESSAIGAGVKYFSSNIFNQGNFSLMYSQRFFSDKLALGLSANLLTHGYDTENFFLFDFNDPLVEGSTSKNAFSFGFSLLAQPTSNFLIGFSADHLNAPDISLGKDEFKKDPVLNIGLAYLNWFFVPQIDFRIEGEETVTQGLISKRFYDNNFNVKLGYSAYQEQGSSFFAELDFYIGDLGIMYNFRNQLGDLSEVTDASHQIGIFYTKGKSYSLPEIHLSNIEYNSHLPELELVGKATNESGLDYIEIKNNDVIYDVIRCESNTVTQEISKKVMLQPGENEIVVAAVIEDVVQRERILVNFEPLPPMVNIKSTQNTQVDNDQYEFVVDIKDLVGIEKIDIIFNDNRINSFEQVNKKSETIRLPVILKSGENNFKVVASNQWSSHELSSFITYKSAELPPVLTIESPQMPESPSSSVIINLELENKKYIEEIIIKVNGEQKEVIKLKPTTRGVKTIESSIPVSYEPFASGYASRTVELLSPESIIEAIAYDATGLPRTSSKILKILYNPYQESLKYKKKTAIIIGIDNYKSEKISKLDLAVSDAQNVKNVLNDFYQFDEIYTLYNDKATFTEISRKVYSQLKKAGSQDLIVLYFAGHGITIEDQIGGESGYLLPYDSDLETDLNTLSMTNLNQKAIQSRAKDVLFIIDACYSGLGLISVPPLSQYPSEKINYEKLKNDNSKISRNIITAGGKKQEAVDGLFTRFLKTGLTGAADYNRDNYITSNELGYYLKSNVSKEAKKYNMEQIPQFGSIISDQGELVFSKDK